MKNIHTPSPIVLLLVPVLMFILMVCIKTQPSAHSETYVLSDGSPFHQFQNIISLK